MNGKTYASRMPFTVNMVFSYADDGRNCQDVASLWRIHGIDETIRPRSPDACCRDRWISRG